MPGVAGIISRRSPDECQRLVQSMVEAMKYEPFYASGTHAVPEIGVYGGWVAHQGSFAAFQSGRSNRHEVVLLFSGESFPSFLSAAHPDFVGNNDSDPDVHELLQRYEEEGDRFVGQINGLFSGFLIDRKRKRALVFNDRYGIERIYYYEKDRSIFFASEAKALLRILPELRAFDDEGVAQFLNYGCTLGERTLFRNMQLLPGGSLLIFDESTCRRKEQYFRHEIWESQPALTVDEFELEFIDTFTRILPRYLSSESRIGISLTGGLDSRMIMACIPADTVRPVCYTFTGSSEDILDARLAARVAHACGFEHHAVRIGSDFLLNYGNYVDRTVFATDASSGALGAHEVYLNSQARQLSRVRLTGNFGSELLRSVSTFKPIGLTAQLINPAFSRVFEASVQDFPCNEIHPVSFAAFREIPWNLFGPLAAGRSQLTFRTPYLDNEIVALSYRAPLSARQSPRSALRLVNDRNPDLGRIPTDRGVVWESRSPFHFMRRVFSDVTFKLDYLHKEALPHWLSPLDPLLGALSKFGMLGLHKYLPYRGWFRRELAPYVIEIMTDSQTNRLPYWNPRFLTTIADDLVSGRKNYIREINAVLTLDAAERLLIQGISRPAGSNAGEGTT